MRLRGRHEPSNFRPADAPFLPGKDPRLRRGRAPMAGLARTSRVLPPSPLFLSTMGPILAA
jgi:hypothetical protein